MAIRRLTIDERGLRLRSGQGLRIESKHNRFVSAAIFFVTVTLAFIQGNAAVLDPFPPGFSMSTLDAVIDTKGPTGRQPWLCAAFCSDPGRFGAAFAATSYYNSVNDPDEYRATLGAWYQYHGMVAKTAFSHFSALDVYFEESGFLSIGSRHLKFCTLSAELTGTRMRCSGAPLSYTLAEAGLSAWVPWSWAGISLRLIHLPLKQSGVDGGESPPSILTGIHTLHNRFGSQGALITVTPNDPRPVCFTLGEAYQITPSIAFDCAIANNPALIGFGISVMLGQSSMAVSLANHPKLGWSQGVAAEYWGK
jgi:hypothetical protein